MKTTMTSTEEKMFRHILELESMLAEADGDIEEDEDGNERPIPPHKFAEQVGRKFKFRVDPEYFKRR